MKAKITASLVNSLKPNEDTYKVWDTEHSGFFARVSPKGTITYALRYRSPSDLKDKTLTIGRADRISLSEARRIATQKAGEVAQGIDPQQQRRRLQEESSRKELSTLGDFMEKRYEAYLRSEKRSGESLIRDIRGLWGDYYQQDLRNLDDWFVTDWRNKRLACGIKPSTLNRNIALLRALLNKAVEWKIIEANPMRAIKQLKLDKIPKVRYLNEEELDRLHQAMASRDAKMIAGRDSANEWRKEHNHELFPELPKEGYWDYLTPLIILCLNTGIRRSEALNLAWEDIDLRAKRITVNGNSAKNSHTRHIPLSKKAAGALSKWRKQNQASFGLVFPSPRTGGRLVNINKAWKSLKRAAAIENFRFHDLRHHFASSLVMRGVELNTVRELLGHSSTEMTLRYAHLAPEHKAAAIARLDD